MAKVLDSNPKEKITGAGLKSSVFEPGNLSITSFKVETSIVSSKTRPLFIVAPTVEGTYPVLQFLHGFMCTNTTYTQLLQHIASHGFIIVAPQAYNSVFTKVSQELADVASVTNWLATELQPVLPEVVMADFTKVALAGHARGGNVAFCLALGKAETSLQFSALIGIDPVAGFNTLFRTKPNILTYIPRSFDLEIPVAVIGAGLAGSQPKNLLIPACAPEGVNHAEFFNECKPPCCYFLAKEYGNLSILDDGAGIIGGCFCKGGLQPKYLMRKGVAGIVVAFMNAYLKGDESDLVAVANNPKTAPITLDPVIYIPS